MTNSYPNLFKPLPIGSKIIKNRIVFGAHTANMSEDGIPGRQHVAYYEERAIGGAGMIVVEPMPVHCTAVLTRGNFRHSDDAVVPAFAHLVDTVKQHETLICQQLYHVGQHGDADLSFEPNWSPSGLPSYHDSDGSHSMSVAEIDEIVDGYVAAAVRCQKAGFDGVEIWAAYHSLIDQFWTPWSNHREDDYGGSFTNRLRFGQRILSSVRDATGSDFIVGLSISVSNNTPHLLQPKDYAAIVGSYDSEGLIDYATVGSGNYLEFDALMPTFVYGEKLTTDATKLIKDNVKNAVVIAESHIRTPENASYVVSSGEADLVSIVRGQIADPHLSNKARDGRADDVRGCISCNQMCWGRRSRDYWISCLVNPSSGREHEWGGDRFDQTSKGKNVLVVGGGPAGLETARVAAERGHHVTLAEATGDLGGAFRLAGLTPRRGQITELIAWYQRQLEKLQVRVLYNSPIEAGDIDRFDAEQIILATGSMPDFSYRQRWLHENELPGIGAGNVWSPEDVIRKEARLGSHVIVLDEGGNWRGIGTALHMANAGHSITIVTPDPMIGKELARTTTDLQARRLLAAAGTTFITESVIAEWHGDGATIRSMLNGESRQVEADSLVMATTNLANSDLAQELSDSSSPVLTVGDCVAPRNAAHAIYEGRKIGLAI